jgi:hypothetical protein
MKSRVLVIIGFLSVFLEANPTEIDVGGRIRQDIIFNSISVGGRGGQNTGDISLSAKKIPLYSTGETNQLSFNARNSRFWLKTMTMTEYGPLRTLMELDFWGSTTANESVSNGYNVRLRHAYFELGNLIFGQTNSTFMSSTPADSISTLVSDMLVRQSQLRYFFKNRYYYVALAIEQPESSVILQDGCIAYPNDDRVPDFIIKSKWHGRWGFLSLSAITREIRIDNQESPNLSKWGGALRVAAMLKTYKYNNIRATAFGGNAIGRYVALNAIPTSYITTSNTMELIPIYGAIVSYQHYITKNTRLNLIYNQTDSKIATINNIAYTKSFKSSHINIRYKIFKSAMLTAEYLYATRVTTNANEGELYRVIFSSSYDF